MITRVSTVIIGESADADSSKIGHVALYDQNKTPITSEQAAALAESVYVGVTTDIVKVNVGGFAGLPENWEGKQHIIDYSNRIDKTSKPSAVFSKHVDPKNSTVEIDLSNAAIVVGHRYVLRIVYKDINEAPGQFTHTYEVIAASKGRDNGELAKSLITSLASRIKNHKGRRINARIDSTGKKLTLTALVRDDNDGVDSINTYSTVSMEASLYETIPGALLSNQPKLIDGAVIKHDEGTPGIGFWKQVRDLEVSNMGYKGHVFTGAYPEVSQPLKTVEDVKYDVITIENDNLYLSNDNQYIKTTPLTTIVFCPSMVNDSQFAKLLKAFLTGEASKATEAKANK